MGSLAESSGLMFLVEYVYFWKLLRLASVYTKVWHLQRPICNPSGDIAFVPHVGFKGTSRASGLGAKRCS